MSRTIELSQGLVAIVDDDDYEWLSQWKWCAWRGQATKSFYAVSNKRKDDPDGPQRIYMHRLILGAQPGQYSDHISTDGLDNRRSNLRLCSNAENGRNQRIRVGGTSGFKGVGWHAARREWRARIKYNYQDIHLGWFKCEHEAARTYDRAALRYFGAFARLNFPQQQGAVS